MWTGIWPRLHSPSLAGSGGKASAGRLLPEACEVNRVWQPLINRKRTRMAGLTPSWSRGSGSARRRFCAEDAGARGSSVTAGVRSTATLWCSPLMLRVHRWRSLLATAMPDAAPSIASVPCPVDDSDASMKCCLCASKSPKRPKTSPAK